MGSHAKISVLFVNPSIKDEPFWHKVQSITEQAAKQLNIELDVIYGEGNRHIQSAELKKYLNYRATPDYVILMNYPGDAEKTMELLEKYKVRYLTLEQTIFGAEKAAIGEPQGYFKSWLGEVYHDNHKAGYFLAKSLVEESKLPAEKINAVVINGHYGSESESRESGAMAYFNEKKINVYQSIHASWSKEQAFDKTKKLMTRYKNINLIWSASDLMAMGALTGKKVANTKHSVFIGGFDWLADALNLIKNGQLTSSIGGHFMMGGWALLTLYDYHNGNEYWKQNTRLFVPLEVITKHNVEQYSWMFDKPDWSKVNFKDMSLIENKRKTYEFSVEKLFRD